MAFGVSFLAVFELLSDNFLLFVGRLLVLIAVFFVPLFFFLLLLFASVPDFGKTDRLFILMRPSIFVCLAERASSITAEAYNNDGVNTRAKPSCTGVC